jgi:hypothetical protein
MEVNEVSDVLVTRDGKEIYMQMEDQTCWMYKNGFWDVAFCLG